MKDSSIQDADRFIGWCSGFKKNTFGCSIKSIKAKCYLYFLGIVSIFFRRKAVSVEACEVLLLQASEKVVGYNRKSAFKKQLVESGVLMKEVPMLTISKVFLSRSLYGEVEHKGFKYFFLQCYAKYLVTKYRPKVILNDRNGALLSVFLKEEVENIGGVLVQLAHATTTEGSRKLALNHYHYYFLFGMSSYDALLKRDVMVGDSKAVIVGSHMVDKTFDIPPETFENKTILLLGVGPDREKEDVGIKNYELIFEWVCTRPDLTLMIKAHPRSDLSFWLEKSTSHQNIKVFDKKVLLSEAFRVAGAVISISSNAIIEAALSRRPLICVDRTGGDDIFSFEKIYGEIAKNAFEIDRSYEDIVQNYDENLERSERFSNYHLSHGFDGLDNTVSAVQMLLKNKEVDFLPLKAK
ncbi:hypothetical protein [Endozoicomonas ascidiicola]|uniref:hypothetical protein n=1 Tax=Endozoicomonas ascidiicola TaxID=1698521 RepID=UPI00082D5323|nr:hypothetical protein [Endozoicomonas ascidiicola]